MYDIKYDIDAKVVCFVQAFEVLMVINYCLYLIILDQLVDGS